MGGSGFAGERGGVAGAVDLGGDGLDVHHGRSGRGWWPGEGVRRPRGVPTDQQGGTRSQDQRSRGISALSSHDASGRLQCRPSAGCAGLGLQPGIVRAMLCQAIEAEISRVIS